MDHIEVKICHYLLNLVSFQTHKALVNLQNTVITVFVYKTWGFRSSIEIQVTKI